MALAAYRRRSPPCRGTPPMLQGTPVRVGRAVRVLATCARGAASHPDGFPGGLNRLALRGVDWAPPRCRHPRQQRSLAQH